MSAALDRRQAPAGWRHWLLADTPASPLQARLGQAYHSWLVFRANPMALVGLGIVLLLVLVAALAPVLATHSPILQDLAQRLQPGATLAVISSVAGDRGRASNYLYGSAKAAVSTFLSGLRQRLRPIGIHVLTIKPGFVDTPMTSTFKKGALWAKPVGVARGIVKAVDSRRPIAYLPSFWWAIMLMIKAIPEFIFVRIKL